MIFVTFVGYKKTTIQSLLTSTSKLQMFKIFRTKWFRSAPVVATLWLSSTAVILIGVNYVAPDYLFMPVSWFYFRYKSKLFRSNWILCFNWKSGWVRLKKQEIKLLIASSYLRGTREGPLATSLKKDRLVNLSLIDRGVRIWICDLMLSNQ